ncbi:antitoxin Xre/MbcA/ParS toxin-binding domain-containing protein [Pseudomonas sp. B15(2017)]|uniref:type II RES/Xre toxin-antitoxin system antitoxin n=1 Tax=Pseudomonas sp. B15(2017) TaxID=1981744 RepID=UPI002113D799|nr:antitoxin Xre/MbcA/ParS toxin-binding domain-containing protein [Pseudomonas sp. B15(2017)]
MFYSHLTEKTNHLTELLMVTAATALRSTKKQNDLREEGVEAFWSFSTNRDSLRDSERLEQIKEGFSAALVQGLRAAFCLHERSVEILMNASTSTLDRRRREHKKLDSVASERLDRIAAVCGLAEEVFESREAAAQWMSTPNKALGGDAPVMLCETEIGAKQVRRVLHALEWGGAA